MAWTSISNAAVAVGAIPSSSTVTALRDNPAAMAETATGAPVVFAGWHPVDKVSVGDGRTGLIYDHAVDGTTATIETPDFEDGYEYRIVVDNVSHNDGANNRGFLMDLDDGGYTTVIDRGSVSSTSSQNLDIEILMPRLGKTRSFVRYIYQNSSSSAVLDAGFIATGGAKIIRARIRFTSGSIDSGKIWLFRRREYVTIG
jgi:hypothetical protein